MVKNSLKLETDYSQCKSAPNYNKTNKLIIKICIEYNHDLSGVDIEKITREYTNKFIYNYEENK
jgi:hypothetical protein